MNTAIKPISILFNGMTQKTQILEFSHADEYTSITFDIEKLSGVNDISFVFLPGANFDMESFKFE